MEHHTTIPSTLGPAGGLGSPGVQDRPAARKPSESESSPIFKLVFWAAVAVLLLSVFRYFTR